MFTPSDTQPIPTVGQPEPVADDDATVVFAPPQPQPQVLVVTAANPGRTWARRLLSAVIGLLLLVGGALVGAYAVSQQTYSSAEVEHASSTAVQEGFDAGYEEGHDDATQAAETEASDAYRTGYQDGYAEGVEQAQSQQAVPAPTEAPQPEAGQPEAG